MQRADPKGGAIPARSKAEAIAGAIRPMPNRTGPKLNANAIRRILALSPFPPPRSQRVACCGARPSAALRQRFPNHRLIVSTTTMTGQAVARQQVHDADAVCYFPFDWTFTVRRALDVVQPQIVILMESELWLNFLCECRGRQIPTVVVNGRISDRSFPRSQKFGFFVGRLYRLVTRFLMQGR